jgi:hypothetical protein
MFAICNYNRYVMGTVEKFNLEDLRHHRFPGDFAKLLKFYTREDAQNFINQNPDLYPDELWPVNLNPDNWVSYSSPWEPRKVHPSDIDKVNEIVRKFYAV